MSASPAKTFSLDPPITNKTCLETILTTTWSSLPNNYKEVYNVALYRLAQDRANGRASGSSLSQKDLSPYVSAALDEAVSGAFQPDWIALRSTQSRPKGGFVKYVARVASHAEAMDASTSEADLAPSNSMIASDSVAAATRTAQGSLIDATERLRTAQAVNTAAKLYSKDLYNKLPGAPSADHIFGADGLILDRYVSLFFTSPPQTLAEFAAGVACGLQASNNVARIEGNPFLLGSVAYDQWEWTLKKVETLLPNIAKPLQRDHAIRMSAMHVFRRFILTTDAWSGYAGLINVSRILFNNSNVEFSEQKAQRYWQLALRQTGNLITHPQMIDYGTGESIAPRFAAADKEALWVQAWANPERALTLVDVKGLHAFYQKVGLCPKEGSSIPEATIVKANIGNAVGGLAPASPGFEACVGSVTNIAGQCTNVTAALADDRDAQSLVGNTGRTKLAKIGCSALDSVVLVQVARTDKSGGALMNAACSRLQLDANTIMSMPDSQLDKLAVTATMTNPVTGKVILENLEAEYFPTYVDPHTFHIALMFAGGGRMDSLIAREFCNTEGGSNTKLGRWAPRVLFSFASSGSERAENSWGVAAGITRDTNQRLEALVTQQRKLECYVRIGGEIYRAKFSMKPEAEHSLQVHCRKPEKISQIASLRVMKLPDTDAPPILADLLQDTELLDYSTTTKPEDVELKMATNKPRRMQLSSRQGFKRSAAVAFGRQSTV